MYKYFYLIVIAGLIGCSATRNLSGYKNSEGNITFSLEVPLGTYQAAHSLIPISEEVEIYFFSLPNKVGDYDLKSISFRKYSSGETINLNGLLNLKCKEMNYFMEIDAYLSDETEFHANGLYLTKIPCQGN